MREFRFTSFSSMPESLQPSCEQQEAAYNLVRMLDLSPSEDEELLQPEQTINPVLQVGLINLLAVTESFCNPFFQFTSVTMVLTSVLNAFCYLPLLLRHCSVLRPWHCRTTNE